MNSEPGIYPRICICGGLVISRHLFGAQRGLVYGIFPVGNPSKVFCLFELHLFGDLGSVLKNKNV